MIVLVVADSEKLIKRLPGEGLSTFSNSFSFTSFISTNR
jgi:hypothetical protein